MISGYENKKIKLNYDLTREGQRYKKDSIITVRTKDGVCIDKFWLERQKDSKTDNCIEFLDSKPIKAAIPAKK